MKSTPERYNGTQCEQCVYRLKENNPESNTFWCRIKTHDPVEIGQPCTIGEREQ